MFMCIIADSNYSFNNMCLQLHIVYGIYAVVSICSNVYTHGLISAAFINLSSQLLLILILLTTSKNVVIINGDMYSKGKLK